MRFVSTRGSAPVTVDDALLQGIASDGGLFVAAELPHFEIADFDGASSIVDVGERLLQPFFAESRLSADLRAILAETYTFATPVNTQAEPALLELFHGPTAAFKDVGAGFLAACLARLAGDEENPLTILVATSGDTGGAVAAAFDGRPGIRVVVLYPQGRVSARQEAQLTCWGNNVLSLRVDGAFDDCQSLVKAALADYELNRKYRFSSANSINIGRLLPQSTYYAYAALQHWRRHSEKPGFIVPTGNLGNAFACIMAREMGLPIGPVVLAVNSNKTIPEFLRTGNWLPQISIATLASAMDVGNPSNMERLRNLKGDAAGVAQAVDVRSVSDTEISTEIAQFFAATGIAICPHTATATYTWRHLAAEQRDAQRFIAVSTAHAAKFESVVEPLIGNPVPLPESLEALLNRPCHSEPLAATLPALADALGKRFGHV